MIGLLFGRGNGGSTTYQDDKRDGITNPPPICTSDGLSSGQVCNDRVSEHPDDDGGYLRLAARQYYTDGPRPLTPGMGAAPAPRPAPVPAGPPAAAPMSLIVELGEAWLDPDQASQGQIVTLSQTFTPSSEATVLVDFELYDGQGRKAWQQWLDGLPVSAGQSRTAILDFTVPAHLPPGRYVFNVGVFSNEWGTLYAWNNQAGNLEVSD